MRHIYSTDSQTLLKEFGDNVFSCPGTRPPLSSWNSAPGWSCTQASENRSCTGDGQIASSGTRARLFFKFAPTTNTDFSAEVHPHLQGRPASLRDGVRQPRRHLPRARAAHRARPSTSSGLRGSWVTEQFQLQGGYTASVFVNDFPWVRADNPCLGANNTVPVPALACPAAGTPGSVRHHVAASQQPGAHLQPAGRRQPAHAHAGQRQLHLSV